MNYNLLNFMMICWMITVWITKDSIMTKEEFNQ